MISDKKIEAALLAGEEIELCFKAPIILSKIALTNKRLLIRWYERNGPLRSEIKEYSYSAIESIHITKGLLLTSTLHIAFHKKRYDTKFGHVNSLSFPGFKTKDLERIIKIVRERIQDNNDFV